MKTRFLLLLSLFLFNVIHCSAQQDLKGKAYCLISDKTWPFCQIHFFPNGEYFIDISKKKTDDIVYSFILSFGQYEENNNCVSLKDEIMGYEIRMSSTNDTLDVIKAFSFMQGGRFAFCEKEYKANAPDIDHTSLLKVKEERQQYFHNNKKSFDLEYGIYVAESTIIDYKLHLLDNQTYQLQYLSYTISEGTWKKYGNELNLFDKNMEYTFYMLVGEKQLISKLLPGDKAGNLILKLKQNNDLETVPNIKQKWFGCSRRK